MNKKENNKDVRSSLWEFYTSIDRYLVRLPIHRIVSSTEQGFEEGRTCSYHTSLQGTKRLGYPKKRYPSGKTPSFEEHFAGYSASKYELVLRFR